MEMIVTIAAIIPNKSARMFPKSVPGSIDVARLYILFNESKKPFPERSNIFWVESPGSLKGINVFPLIASDIPCPKFTAISYIP